MSLLLQNISKFYGSQKALDGISLDIPNGQIVGLLGPNGAGKSTLMKILTTYLPASSGKAYVCQLDVQSQAAEVRKKLGYLPENNPLYLDLYVREYLQFMASLHLPKSAVKEAVESIIEQTHLGAEAHKTIGQLSKGYRQRVGLAQALVHQPEVLILDEPTTGLDPNQLLEIRQLIKTLGKEKTLILSTHILQEVQAVCDRVVILHHGHIVADQSLADTPHLEELFYTVTH